MILLPLFSACSYLHARLEDLHDCFLYEARLGLGISADARVMPVAAGVGFSGSACVGKPTWKERPRVFTETEVHPPVCWIEGPIVGDPIMLGATEMLFKGESFETQVASISARIAGLGSPDLGRCVARARGLYEEEDLARMTPLLDTFGIDAGVFAGVVGVRLGFNLAEFADFVTGLVGVDLLDDDLRTKSKPPKPTDHPPKSDQPHEPTEPPLTPHARRRASPRA